MLSCCSLELRSKLCLGDVRRAALLASPSNTVKLASMPIDGPLGDCNGICATMKMWGKSTSTTLDSNLELTCAHGANGDSNSSAKAKHGRLECAMPKKEPLFKINKAASETSSQPVGIVAILPWLVTSHVPKPKIDVNVVPSSPPSPPPPSPLSYWELAAVGEWEDAAVKMDGETCDTDGQHSSPPRAEGGGSQDNAKKDVSTLTDGKQVGLWVSVLLVALLGGLLRSVCKTRAGTRWRPALRSGACWAASADIFATLKTSCLRRTPVRGADVGCRTLCDNRRSSHFEPVGDAIPTKNDEKGEVKV